MKKLLTLVIVLALLWCAALAEDTIPNDAKPDPADAPAEAEQSTYPPFITEEMLAQYTPLEKGSKGDEVKQLQQRLVDLYWLDGSVDGDFGNKTRDAVERFQTEVGLMATGIADPMTQAMLFAEGAPEATMSVSCSVVAINGYGQAAWYVNGQSFTLTGSQAKKIKTPWGTFLFNALGEYTQID